MTTFPTFKPGDLVTITDDICFLDSAEDERFGAVLYEGDVGIVIAGPDVADHRQTFKVDPEEGVYYVLVRQTYGSSLARFLRPMYDDEEETRGR